MTKTLNKLGKEGNFQNLIKDAYKKHRGNIMLNGERLNGFPLRFRKKTRVFAFIASINIVLEVLTRENKQKEDNIQTGEK